MITTSTDDRTVSTRNFPKIMQTKENLRVLFSEPSRGMVLDAGNARSWKVGEFCQLFDMSQFKDFTGTVTLEQK